MLLTHLTIENYKNCPKAYLKFKRKFNCFTGKNGTGKTNMLDAIYFLCCGKSYFNAQDSQLIMTKEKYFSIEGNFSREGNDEGVRAVQMLGRRKVIKRNEVAYERIIDHYGNYPVVMIAPGDMELIYGISEDRRKWMDSVISMVDKQYLHNLLKYDKILQQRNALLKKMNIDGKKDAKLCEVYNDMLAPVGTSIFDERERFLKEFMSHFLKYYKHISGNAEVPEIDYDSAMRKTNLDILLKKNFDQDYVTQRTNYGTHKDDLSFIINVMPVKKFASQGQQKTFLFALKLAQYRYVMRNTETQPLLLLDDVCERLDDNRTADLMDLLTHIEFGQIFITDTSESRLKALLPHTTETIYYPVMDGEVNK